MDAKKVVIAIGGNAIQPPGDTGGAEAQLRRIEETAGRLADLVQAGYTFVLTHGNGPQVGNILLQNEESRHLVPSMPLDVCGAESQAQIGYMIEQALRNEFAKRRIDRGVACLVTQVLVDADDPAFRTPTKPIGPYYTKEADLIVKRAKGWKLVQDPRGGFRRVVPSPAPIDIVERETILRLVEDGDGLVVIAAGGGGIPVVRKGGRFVGVEAVIDKDLAAAVLAKVLGWKILVIATDVEKVALNFGKPSQHLLDRMTLAEAKKHLAAGQFPPGSMGPKVQAAVRFLEQGGERAVITDLGHLVPAVEGQAGTLVEKD